MHLSYYSCTEDAKVGSEVYNKLEEAPGGWSNSWIHGRKSKADALVQADLTGGTFINEDVISRIAQDWCVSSQWSPKIVGDSIANRQLQGLCSPVTKRSR